MMAWLLMKHEGRHSMTANVFAALRSGCLKINSFDKQCLWQTFFKGAVISCKNYGYGNVFYLVEFNNRVCIYNICTN